MCGLGEDGVQETRSTETDLNQGTYGGGVGYTYRPRDLGGGCDTQIGGPGWGVRHRSGDLRGGVGDTDRGTWGLDRVHRLRVLGGWDTGRGTKGGGGVHKPRDRTTEESRTRGGRSSLNSEIILSYIPDLTTEGRWGWVSCHDPNWAETDV